MVLRGKYICNYELKNYELSSSALGFGAVSSCCWDSWGLCPSYVLPPSSSTQSSSQLSSWGQQLMSPHRRGCSWAKCLLTLPRWVSVLGKEGKVGTLPSRGDADPACRAMGCQGSDLSWLPVSPRSGKRNFLKASEKRHQSQSTELNWWNLYQLVCPHHGAFLAVAVPASNGMSLG